MGVGLGLPARPSFLLCPHVALRGPCRSTLFRGSALSLTRVSSVGAHVASLLTEGASVFWLRSAAHWGAGLYFSGMFSVLEVGTCTLPPGPRGGAAAVLTEGSATGALRWAVRGCAALGAGAAGLPIRHSERRQGPQSWSPGPRLPSLSRRPGLPEPPPCREEGRRSGVGSWSETQN